MPYREPEHHEREPSAPSYIEGPIPWENAALSWPRRFLSTLGASFLPTETARSVADGPLGPAVGFALLSALPWSLLWAIVPFTHTLNFHNLTIDVLSKPGLSVGSDVAQAGAIGLAYSLAVMASWSVPFASLLKAFAREQDQALAPTAAYRTALYRVWLVPFGASLFWLSVWALPPTPPGLLADLAWLFFQMLPRILILLHCHAMARYFGASTGTALLVAVVPLGVEVAVGPWIWHVAKGFLPEQPVGPAGAGS